MKTERRSIGALNANPSAKKRARIAASPLRLISLFGCGALAGYYWLLPVFVPPGSPSVFDDTGLSIQRIMRIAGVLLIFPLAAGRAIRLPLRERIIRLALWVFMLAPATSLFFESGLNFLIGTYGPFLAGGLALVCISAFDQDEFAAWLAGVGLAATVFLILGLRQYGLDPTWFYGRPRSHIGFIHPTQTASVIIVAGLFSIQCARWFLRRLRWLLWPVLAGIVAGVFFLLISASSRNTALTAFLIVSCAAYAQIVKNSSARTGLVLILLLAPFIGYTVAVYGNMQSELWIALESFSSERLITYRELAKRLADASSLVALIGPPLGSTGGGFASAESAYMSVFLNFGFLTLASLFVFLFALGRRLSKGGHSLAYGCLCAVIIFFAIDAQGITPSNLAIFILLAYVVRNALSRSMAAT